MRSAQAKWRRRKLTGTGKLATILLGFFLLGLLTRSAKPQAFTTATPTSPDYSLATQRDAVLTVRGPFRFQAGDDLRWRSEEFNDAHWPLRIAGSKWDDDKGQSYRCGLAWYRFTVSLPPGNDPYSILLPHINTTYQMFVDGQLLITEGAMPPRAVMYNTVPTLVGIPESLRSRRAPLHVALRIWHDPDWAAYMTPGLMGPVIIGRSSLVRETFTIEELGRLWRNSDWIDLTALEILGALAALGLFYSVPAEREYLWFSVLALGSSLNHGLKLWGRLHSHPVQSLESAESFCFTAYLFASVLFYRTLLREQKSRGYQLALLSCLLWFVDTQIGISARFGARAENTGELMFTFPVYAWILYVVLQRARQRWPDAHLLAIPVALLLATAFYYQLIFTIRTFGHPGAARYYPILRGSFFADLKDFGEIFFLLAVVLILGNRFARTRREAERTASELEAARAVQRVLVPEALPSTPGLTIAAVYHPAEQVGGDFFQILPLSTGEVLIAIGDVAGKGLPAALTVSLILGTLRAIVGDASGPGTLMKRLNTALGGDGAIFATCMLLQFSMQTATVTIANAGHLPAYCNRCELEITTALPLGMSPDAIFPEESFSLCGGEHIVLMTDRVPEAMHARELFGFERAGALTHRCAAQIADVARAFGQMDDITVLSIDVQIGLQSIAGHHRALGDS